MDEQLVIQNMPFVYYLLNKYYPAYAKDEDVIQCGMLGLVKACKNYDPEKGKFSTYSVNFIRHEINVELKRREKDKCLISLEDLKGEI